MAQDDQEALAAQWAAELEKEAQGGDAAPAAAQPAAAQPVGGPGVPGQTAAAPTGDAKQDEEALAAQAAGADYLGVGAAFVTGTKTDAKPISRETIRAITAAVDIPVVAIGGISHDNILELKNCGLDGVAVVSALFAQADVKAAAEELLRLSEEIAR